MPLIEKINVSSLFNHPRPSERQQLALDLAADRGLEQTRAQLIEFLTIWRKSSLCDSDHTVYQAARSLAHFQNIDGVKEAFEDICRLFKQDPGAQWIVDELQEGFDLGTKQFNARQQVVSKCGCG